MYYCPIYPRMHLYELETISVHLFQLETRRVTFISKAMVISSLTDTFAILF